MQCTVEWKNKGNEKAAKDLKNQHLRPSHRETFLGERMLEIALIVARKSDRDRSGQLR